MNRGQIDKLLTYTDNIRQQCEELNSIGRAHEVLADRDKAVKFYKMAEDINGYQRSIVNLIKRTHLSMDL